MNKPEWIDAAEVFDTWRVVPRCVLFGYCWWVTHVTDWILGWYQKLPGPERTLETSGLAGAIITAVTGMAIWVYKIYTNNSTDWGARANRIATSRSTTTTTIK